MTPPPIRYTRSGEVDIAYTAFGDGPVDIVYVPGFISHLDLCWEVPAFASLLNGLGQIGRVLTFDKRGTGLSGRDLGFGSLAERMDDIRAVMDADGLERAHLVGVSEGGPLSILFAATYPERVESLVLYGSYASLLAVNRATPPEEVEALFEYLGDAWGTGEVLAFLLHAPADAATQTLLGRYERSCASPRLAVDVQQRNYEIDVRSLLPSVSARALVLHRTLDPLISIEVAQELAAGLANATLIELPGEMHCAWTAAEWAPAFDAIAEFVTGARAAPAVDRMVATVLFTDIVDSTRLASEAGDRAWRDLLDRHDAATNRIIDRFGGRLVKQTGDGMLATFDGPARAVTCASAVRDELGSLGIAIRAGLHTGEIERRGDDIGGIGVHIGARVAALAGSGEVFVSRTVRDLVIGSDLRFEDRGAYVLKGVPDEWQLYEAVS